MIKLPIPLQRKTRSLKKMTAEELFVHCVNGYAAQEKREHLLKARPMVVSDAAEYRIQVPQKHFEPSALPEDVEKAEMVRLYEYQLVRKEGAGRPYYDAILNHSLHDRCPYCGTQMVSTLDHYLPKSSYPTLAVAPENLIPCCMECNHRKRDGVALSPEKYPIHSYLDEIPDEPWLHVRLGKHLQATYYVQCPESWDPLLRSRLENHVEMFRLKPMYRKLASAEIGECISEWLSFFEMSEQMLECVIRTRRQRIEQSGQQYWKAALYRALEQNMDLLIDYLRRNADRIKQPVRSKLTV